MNTQVAAALISGGVALIVALLGIAGAIAAQLLASRRAAENSLALLRQQYAEQDKQMRQQYAEQEKQMRQQYAKQELERHEEARREDAYRFAMERKTAYARFLRLAGELRNDRETTRRAEEGARRIQDSPFARSLVPEYLKPWEPVEEARAREKEVSTELDDAHEEIQLIGSPDIQLAAGMLVTEVRRVRRKDDDEAAALGPYRVPDRDYRHARDRFLAAARKDLGIAADSEA